MPCCSPWCARPRRPPPGPRCGPRWPAGELPPALEMFALFTTALVAIAFLVPIDYYYHYAAFLGPFLALAVVLPVSRLAGVLRSRRQAAGSAGGPRRPGCCTGAGWPSRPRWCWCWPCCRHGRSPTRTTTAWRTRWWPTSGSSRPARASWPTRCPTRSRPTGSSPRCPAARSSWTPSAATMPCRTAATASAGPATRPPCGSSGCPPCRTRSTCGCPGCGRGGSPWTPAIASYFNAHFRLIRTDASGQVFQRVRAGR